MGNSQSNEEAKSPSSKSSPATYTHAPPVRERSREKPQRRPQSHATRTSSTAPPPSATLVPSSSTASTSTTNTHAHATVSHSPASSHTRARSITQTVPKLKHDESTGGHSQKSENSPMGNSESRHRPPSRAATLPPQTSTPADAEKPVTSPSSRPVDVPQPHDGLNEKEAIAPSVVLGADESPYSLASGPARFDRPPRLPLPIEQEPHTPGSPIITPQDLSSPLEQSAVDGDIPRRASVLSSTTVDDEDVVDQDGFGTVQSQSLAPTVPTTISWKGGGDKIYVTGTFVNWERKFKLHRDKEEGGFSATLQLKPGTHHLKFLVDGDMITSDDMPTTVDYTNILVNYIEVVAPLPNAAQTQPPAPAEPMPIPGAAITAGQATATGEPAARPLDIRTAARAPETAADVPSTLHETFAPEINQPSPIPTQSTPTQPAPTPTPSAAQHQQPTPAPAPPKQTLPRPQYTSRIPDFLMDLDRVNPEDEQYQRAKRIEQHLPQPPSLPMFLGKSILNGTTPHKDDASVLIMPNHTVLNHLATSSIKHGVLATSGTTRYKRKFLTTIMYKPTSSDG